MAVTQINTQNVKDDAITFAKTQNIATSRLLGRLTAGSGNIEELTATDAKTVLALNSGDITGALGYTPVNKNGDTMTGFLTLNADPTSALHAVTKQYVDAIATGLDWKASVRAATTANITLNDEQTIDGVVLVDGDRVLVKAQTAGEENGIYIVVDNDDWIRSPDADTSAEVTSGLATFVEEGTLYGGTAWILTTANPIVLDTTVLVFTQFSGGSTYTAGDGLQLTGNQFDVLVDTTTIDFNGSNELELIGFGTLTTSDLTEGTNLYYTDARARSALAGTANRIDYNSSTGVINIHTSYVGQSSITTLGTITTGTWQGTTLATGFGGTGLTTYTAGDLIYCSSANVLSKLAIGTTGQVLVVNGSNLPAWATPSSTAFKTNVFNEIPTGTINGSNDTFSLAQTPSPTGSLMLFKNGMFQLVGSGNDFTLSGSTITFEAGNIPQTGDVIVAHYTY